MLYSENSSLMASYIAITLSNLSQTICDNQTLVIKLIAMYLLDQHEN